TRALGVVSCGTSAAPWTLSVSTDKAYMLYDDWSLYEVDLGSLACKKTAYQPGQVGFTGREGITVGAGNAADRFYVYGQRSVPSLALSDLSTYRLFAVGDITPTTDAFPADIE